MSVKIKFGQPYFTETELTAAREALMKKRLTCAGNVLRFEEQFTNVCGGGAAVAVTSCMSALQLCLMMKTVGPGDEVIVPATTHPATANAVELLGAKPVFCDVHPEAGSLDPDMLPDLVTPKTKGVIVVHYIGRPGYLRSLVSFCRDRDLFLLEDCALALGAFHSEKHVGLHGIAGCFSFYPVKHITTGEGGMILTSDPEFAERARLLRSFGKDDRTGDYIALGTNFRMTEMQAAVGCAQIDKLRRILRKRKENYDFLDGYLRDFEKVDASFGSHYCLTAFLPDGVDQAKARASMLADHIETSVYYPRPVPLTLYYRKKYGYTEGMFPVSERISGRSVALSVGPHLKVWDMQRQADSFKKACALHS